MNDQLTNEVHSFESPSADAINWNKPYYNRNRQPFIPRIDESKEQADLSADHFNAATIYLDGKLKADLNWKASEEQAQALIEKGYAIFWDIDLGLFNQLPSPLTNQTQYLSLSLSLDHFRDTVWRRFKDETIGLSIYRGPLDFSQCFAWDERQINNLRGWLEDRFETIDSFTHALSLSISRFEQLELSHLFQSEIGHQLIRLFCRDVAVEYLTLLTNRLPDRLPRYLLMDATPIVNPLWQAQLLHPERFEQFGLGVKGSLLPIQGFGWQTPSAYGTIADEPLPIRSLQETTIGVCLPALDYCCPSHYRGMEAVLHQLLEKQRPFRLISETHLITEWDGLDYLFVVPAGLGAQGKRKLQGFCAAGGAIVTVGEKIGLAQEIFASDFIY